MSDSNTMVDVFGLDCHRGRIQAQGDGLEKSVSWNRATPPMSKEELSMLDELTESLTKGELKARQEAIDKAKKWIINAGKNGGADASISKTFLIKGT